jgi:4-hydroxy-tetrahydrodipicolinate synthase
MRLQYRLLELFDAMLSCSADFPSGFRAAVELRGFHLGQSRQPLSELQQDQLAVLKESLERMLFDFGCIGPGTASGAALQQTSR